jgi:hypothetical protein
VGSLWPEGLPVCLSVLIRGEGAVWA